ncbi:replication-associated protein [Tundra vole stool-associated circular virus]|nr:replication-associated protein [Tundra vole stool-associated circular virus]
MSSKKKLTQSIYSTSMVQRSRGWMGTIWSMEDVREITKIATRYKIISDRDVTTQGQEHWHCYLYFNNAVVRPSKGSAMTHWEPAVDPLGAISYCKSKGTNFFEYGDIPTGKKNIKEKFNEFTEACKKKDDKYLIENHGILFARYQRYAHTVRSIYTRPETLEGDLMHIWINGPAGCGKTSWVHKTFPPDLLYLKLINKWWDSYSGEPVVLMDDVDPNNLSYIIGMVKHWADRYAFKAEYKGGSKDIRPQIFIVTSNYTIDQCVPNEEDRAAFKRRFVELKVEDLPMMRAAIKDFLEYPDRGGNNPFRDHANGAQN